MFVHISSQQRERRLLGQDFFIFRSQLQQFVVLLEVKQVVSVIDHDVAIARQFLNRNLRDFGRLLIFAGPHQIAFFFPHYLRILLHLWIGAAQPLRCERELLAFDSGIHAAGNNQAIGGGKFISLPIFGLGLRKISARSVHVAQSQIGNIEPRVSSL